MIQAIIIITAAICAVFLVVWGAVSNQAGVLSTGTGLLGVLLGFIGAQPAVLTGANKLLCKIGIHSFKHRDVDGCCLVKTCERCYRQRKERIL